MTGILGTLTELGFRSYGPNDTDENVPPAPDDSARPGSIGYRPFEDPRPPKGQRYIAMTDDLEGPELFRYFLDGSMRTTNAGHIVDTGGRYLPIFASQVGVGVTKTERRRLTVEDHRAKTALVLPDSIPDHRWRDIRRGIRELSHSFPLSFEVMDYHYDAETKPVDSVRQTILHAMHQLEVEKIADMAAAGAMTKEALLMVDGSLQFYVGIDQHREAFRNVVGVAKSFNVHDRIGSGDNARHIGAVVADLPNKHRTPVRKPAAQRSRTIFNWYLRIRPVHAHAGLGRTDGVVKVEVFPEDQDGQEPLDGNRCDSISRDILALAHPATPPTTDARWASHLYPVHLTERYIKSRFVSDRVIQACL